jgi:hypothetical protein
MTRHLKPTRQEFIDQILRIAPGATAVAADRGVRTTVSSQEAADKIFQAAIDFGLAPRPVEPAGGLRALYRIEIFGFPRRRADAYFPADDQDDNLKAIFHSIRAAKELLPHDARIEDYVEFMDRVDGLATKGLGLLEGKGK